MNVVPFLKEKVKSSLDPKYIMYLTLGSVFFLGIASLMISTGFQYEPNKALAPLWALFLLQLLLCTVTFSVFVIKPYKALKANKRYSLKDGVTKWNKEKMQSIANKNDFDDEKNMVFVRLKEFNGEKLSFQVDITTGEIEKINLKKRNIAETLKNEIKKETGFTVTDIFFKISYYDKY